MKSPNLILVAIIAIVATVFIFVISVVDIQAPTVDNISDADIDILDAVNENDEAENEYSIFESEELGIRFEYPEEWGVIEETITDWTPSQEIIDSVPEYQGVAFQKSGTLKINGNVFLTSYTDGKSADRGGYWGDVSYLITSEEYINYWCSSPSERPTGNADEFSSCSDFTNLSGITFAQLSGTTNYYGEITNDVDQYYAYHPEHNFYGIAASTVNLAEDGVVSEEFAEQMYRVVMSLEYID